MIVRAKMTVHDRLVDESKHLTLTAGKAYEVLGVNGDDYRLISDDGEPYLYPRDLFDIEDESIPDDWVWQEFEDGWVAIEPPEFARIGFFEDYFDRIPYAVEIFESYLKRMRTK